MFGKRKRLKFIEENKVSKDNQVYLGLGNILVDMNDITGYVLEMRINVNDFKNLLADAWEISDSKSFADTLEWLLAEGHRGEFGDKFVQYKNGDTGALSGKATMAIKELYEYAEDYKFDKKYLDECRSISAWDFERAAFLTRGAYHVGYISQDEAWNILKNRIASAVVSAGFHSWQDYAASFLMGRSICYGADPGDVLYPISDMLNGKEASVWKEYPIGELK